jgi:hypothetical protein
MEAVRFCKKTDGTEYFKLPEYVETCRECEWYYSKPEADAEIARLEADKKELAEQSNLFRRQRNEALDEVKRLRDVLSEIEHHHISENELLEKRLARLVDDCNELLDFFDSDGETPLVIDDQLDRFRKAIAAAESGKEVIK